MAAAGFSVNTFEGIQQLPEGFRIEASKTQQDACKMFIGGLSNDISKRALLEYLSQFGKILDLLIKTDPDTGLSRGFGFVLFGEIAAVEKALRVREHQVDGRKIELKRAKAMVFYSARKKVFVGGLNPRMPEGKIREYFGTFGEIQDIEFPLCPRTNERRAFCFIVYSHEYPVRKLLETRYHLIGSSRCEVKMALPKEHSRPLRQPGRNTSSSRSGNGWGAGFQANLATQQVNLGGLRNHNVFQPNPSVLRMNQNILGANHSALGANHDALGTNQNAFWVPQNVPVANRNVFGMVDGGRGAPSTMVPVPFPGSIDSLNATHQFYGNFQNVFSNPPVFNSYGGDHVLTYNYGTRDVGPVYANYNVQANQAIPFGNGYQGLY